jgi:hypothetical protein
LTLGSPCIDAGDPASPHDPDESVADMGALPFEQEMALNPERSAVPRYGLEQNYPNPFNANTSISFVLPHAADVRATVYDVTGRLVATLAEGWMPAGEHHVSLDAASWPSGIYIYHLQSAEFSASRKLVVLK